MIFQGQVRLDDAAMTHWRPDKRAHSDGLDDISTASTDQPGRAVVSAPRSITHTSSRDAAVNVTRPTPESVDLDCLG